MTTSTTTLVLKVPAVNEVAPSYRLMPNLLAALCVQCTMGYLEELDSGAIERLVKQSRFLLCMYEDELAKDAASHATESARSNLIALWHTIKQIYGKTAVQDVANLVNSELFLSAKASIRSERS